MAVFLSRANVALDLGVVPDPLRQAGLHAFTHPLQVGGKALPGDAQSPLIGADWP